MKEKLNNRSDMIGSNGIEKMIEIVDKCRIVMIGKLMRIEKLEMEVVMIEKGIEVEVMNEVDNRWSDDMKEIGYNRIRSKNKKKSGLEREKKNGEKRKNIVVDKEKIGILEKEINENIMRKKKGNEVKGMIDEVEKSRGEGEIERKVFRRKDKERKEMVNLKRKVKKKGRRSIEIIKWRRIEKRIEGRKRMEIGMSGEIKIRLEKGKKEKNGKKKESMGVNGKKW